MINGWQFALLVLAYFVLFACALSFANVVPDEEERVASDPADELAPRRLRSNPPVGHEAVRTVHGYGASHKAG